MDATDVTKVRCKDFEPSFTKSGCLYYYQTNTKECGFCKRPTKYRCLHDAGNFNTPIPLSYSTVSDFNVCHHLYYLKAIRGIRTKASMLSNAMKMGVLWDRVKGNKLGGNTDINALIQEYEIPPREVAKVRGLYNAYKFLGIQTEPGGDLQSKIDLKLPFPGIRWGNSWDNKDGLVLPVTGYYDRKYATWFAEDKLTSRPENYEDLWFIQSQVGTYFLADPDLDYCSMEVVRTPALKSSGSHKDETDEQHAERVYQDVISRPSYYFLGWNKDTKTYGKKYYRSEFQLDELKSRYIHIFLELDFAHRAYANLDAEPFAGFYKNDRVCKSILPGIACEYVNVCRYNTMSEEVFEIREKPL